ncbi:hypothetical protein AK95_11685 [Paenibacillus sp. LC231]|nr:hypothetical protein AK95_11685 [Paenibacillus sp. LC231]
MKRRKLFVYLFCLLPACVRKLADFHVQHYSAQQRLAAYTPLVRIPPPGIVKIHRVAIFEDTGSAISLFLPISQQYADKRSAIVRFLED